MPSGWFNAHVLDPARELISMTEVGAEVQDPAAAESLGLGLEACFRSDVADAYDAWPSGSTTDGRSVGTCVRTGEATLDVVGLMWLDFTGRAFPFRALISTTDQSGSLVAYIGEVDAATGAPPSMSPDTVIVPVRDDAGRVVEVEMIAGRRQVPITWTEVFERTSG